MNYICTWFCADKKGEESIFPQTGKKSSSQSHQNIYWRCILLFFITAKRFNTNEKYILFTNADFIPEVDGKDVKNLLRLLEVEIVFTDFKYKTPKGYFNLFQNQFYEFSILEHIATTDKNEDDLYLILDSDCIFIKPVKQLFDAALLNGFMSFDDPVSAEYVINGLSRNDLKNIFEDLLGKKIEEIPAYHLGEFLLSSVKNIENIFKDFQVLWPILLDRNEKNMIKFNEEAHTLSYLYYKNKLQHTTSNHFMKRIWTNPVFYRNVEASDLQLAIWHLPAEKTFGIYQLYKLFVLELDNMGFEMSNENYIITISKIFGIPHLPIASRLRYIGLSYFRAFKKRIEKKLMLPSA